MNPRHLTDEQFDALWQRAESDGHAARLAAQYPAWRTRRRRTTGIVASATVLLLVASPFAMNSLRSSQHEKVYCNRSGISDRQWTDLAAAMLLES